MLKKIILQIQKTILGGWYQRILGFGGTGRRPKNQLKGRLIEGRINSETDFYLYSSPLPPLPEMPEDIAAVYLDARGKFTNGSLFQTIAGASELGAVIEAQIKEDGPTPRDHFLLVFSKKQIV